MSRKQEGACGGGLEVAAEARPRGRDLTWPPRKDQRACPRRCRWSSPCSCARRLSLFCRRHRRRRRARRGRYSGWLGGFRLLRFPIAALTPLGHCSPPPGSVPIPGHPRFGPRRVAGPGRTPGRPGCAEVRQAAPCGPPVAMTEWVRWTGKSRSAKNDGACSKDLAAPVGERNR